MSEKDWTKYFRVIDICYPLSYFDNFHSIDFHYTRTLGVNTKRWSLGSHGRHYRLTEGTTTSKLVELNERNGFVTHLVQLSENTTEIFIHNLANIPYIDRQTWIRTMVVFDETNNLHLSPFLGNNHDLISANDTCVYRLDSFTDASRKLNIQIKLSLKEERAPTSLKFITRIYAKNPVTLCT